MKTKNSCPETFGIKPIFLILLMLGALWWSGCNPDCPNCDEIRVNKVGVDTVYYPYVSDFEADGKIYTYEIIVDGKKFIRSYEMTKFEHKIQHEYDRFWPNNERCSSIECKVKTEEFYEMSCKEIGGSEFESALFQVKDDAFYYQFYGGEYFYRDGVDGYRFHDNLNCIDTTIELEQLKTKIHISWKSTFKLNNRIYSDVTIIAGLENNIDTLWCYAYNKNNGILQSINNEKELENEIKLLKIE